MEATPALAERARQGIDLVSNAKLPRSKSGAHAEALGGITLVTEPARGGSLDDGIALTDQGYNGLLNVRAQHRLAWESAIWSKNSL